MKNLKKRTDDALAFTEFITTKWNDRLTGSKACLETADYIHDALKEYTDQQFKQDFTTRPGGFLGFIRVCVVIYLLSIVSILCNFYTGLIVLAVISLVIFIFEFFLYKEVLEYFFPKKNSRNVYAFLEPEEEVKQQVILSGHHDSAHIFTYYENYTANYFVKIYLGMGCLIASIVFSIIIFLLNWYHASDLVMYILKGIFGLLLIGLWPMWNFLDHKKGSPGAGDNIASIAVTFEILKYFKELKETGKGLKNTRLIIGSWDAEEAGLRGSKAFVRTHKELLKSVPSFNYNLECLYDHKSMNFITTDVNGFVKLNKQMTSDCKQVADKLGYEVEVGPIPFLAGATDAGEFARGGVAATTLNGMSIKQLKQKPSYHTTRDTVDKVDPIAVERSIDIGIEYILKKEKEVQE